MTSPVYDHMPFSNTKGVIDAVYNNDLETFQTFFDLYPECYEITDSDENNVLHLSILLEQYEIFDYILSLERFDLEARNINKETALSIALSIENDNEYFAVKLIDRGANVHDIFYNDNTHLHLALLRHKFVSAKLLIEKGVGIDVQNDDGCTPLHMLFHLKTNPKGISEGVGLMMYYGADVTIVDNQGNIAFELAVLYDSSLIEIQESLFFYSFDEFSNYAMSLEVLMELLETKSSLFLQIADYVSEVIFVKSVYLAPLILFSIEAELLKVLIKKFDYLIIELFNGPLVSWIEFKPSFLRNCEILLNSHLASETVKFFGKLDIDWVIESMNDNQITPKLSIDLIFYLLTYGIKVYDKNFDNIYRNYGYCELFKLLLLMDIEKGYTKSDIVPRIFYDLELNLDKFLSDPHNYSLNSLEKLLNYFAQPKLKKLCYDLNVGNLVSRADSLPEVPFLTEFAREATRNYLVSRYNIKKPGDFFYIVKHLPISRIHQKILTFENKLYW